ncbi:MAG: hypothetical protein DDT40_01940 [candidate division WS2 bacterium]|nr:hypothetical protein [Candidatus Psychracetigena formicireducens]
MLNKRDQTEPSQEAIAITLPLASNTTMVGLPAVSTHKASSLISDMKVKTSRNTPGAKRRNTLLSR